MFGTNIFIPYQVNSNNSTIYIPYKETTFSLGFN